jgi:hypothetical protein
MYPVVLVPSLNLSPGHRASDSNRLLAKHNVQIVADEWNETVFSGDTVQSFVGAKGRGARFLRFKP